MLVTGIKSRPVYSTLEPDLTGRHHLLVAQGKGGDALFCLLSVMPEDASVEVLYAAESHSGTDRSDRLAGRYPDVQVFSTQTEAISTLDRTLAGCFMGIRLYLAGSESFLGSAVQVALKYDLMSDEVRREHCGNSARRVFCIHCKTSNEQVQTNIVPCAGCGRHLLVRDHYSRRLGAYMGVMVDAEAPGEVPPIREAFA